jgi:hypothetical protein
VEEIKKAAGLFAILGALLLRTMSTLTYSSPAARSYLYKITI